MDFPARIYKNTNHGFGFLHSDCKNTYIVKETDKIILGTDKADFMAA